MTALAFRDVAGERRGRMLFERLSFALAPGDAALVTGANGAGKSSLVRMAAGLLRPTAGTVVREGGTALLAEAAALDGDQRAADALGFWARLDGRGPGEVRAALAELDLVALAEVPARLLSTGQRRRLAMARVIASGAPIWQRDEPANGLDAAAVDRLAASIARHREAGGIALVTTHLPVALPRAAAIAL